MAADSGGVPDGGICIMSDVDDAPSPADKPTRAPWTVDFPSVNIHAKENRVKAHSAYAAAKTGDLKAAFELVDAMTNKRLVRGLRKYRERSPVIVPVHGIESASVNAIPVALANLVAVITDFETWSEIVQVSKAGHTGASGWWRLQAQALFSGHVAHGRFHRLVDDFIGMGGTFANLRGHIVSHGGYVLHCQSLTGKPRSATLALAPNTLQMLRGKYGTAFEQWWREQFGVGFDAFTESEARYLLRAEDVDTVRRRLVEARSEREL